MKRPSLLMPAASLGALILLSAGCLRPYSFPPINFTQAPRPDDYPDIGAVELLNKGTMFYRLLDRDGERFPYAVLEHHRRIMILRESGLEYATVSLPIDAFSKVGKVMARTVLPDGSETWLNPDTIRLSYSSPRSDQLQQKTFTIPGARVGAVVEYWYERLYSDLRYIPTWVMGSQLPVVRAEFNLIGHNELRSDVRVGDGPTVTAEPPLRRELPDGQVRLIWIKQDLPPIYPERHMPHLQRLRPWVATVFQGWRQTTNEQTDIRHWDDVAAWARNITKPSQRLDQELEERAMSHSAVHLYRWLQRMTRPLRETRWLWDVRPMGVSDMLLQEHAHCRDLAALMWRMLRHRNDDASLVLVVPANGPVAVPDLPSLQPFTNVVVLIDRGRGDYTVLDPACTFCGFGELPMALQGARGFVVGARRNYWIDLPVSKPESNRTRLELSLTLGIKGDLTGIFMLELTGDGAQRLRGKLHATRDGWEKIILQQVLEQHGGMTISNIEVTNLSAPGAPLKVCGRCTVGLEEIRHQYYSFSSEQVSGGVMSDHWRTKRRYPMATGGPFVLELQLTIKLPIGYAIDAPLPVDVSSRFGEYQARYQGEGGLFMLNRILRVTVPKVSASDYPRFLKFIKKARQAEGMGIVFQSVED